MFTRMPTLMRNLQPIRIFSTAAVQHTEAVSVFPKPLYKATDFLISTPKDPTARSFEKTNNISQQPKLADFLKNHNEEIATYFDQGKYDKLLEKLNEIEPIIREKEPESLAKFLQCKIDVCQALTRKYQNQHDIVKDIDFSHIKKA